MGRCIMVVGCHRSGTSAVAGALHHMGVDMGSELLKPSPFNPRGYYEDRPFVLLNEEIVLDWANPLFSPPEPALMERIREYIARRDEAKIWGVKDPRLCITAHWIAHLFPELRVVSVERSPMASAESLLRVYRDFGRAKARRIVFIYNKMREDFVNSFKGPVMRIAYESLVMEPRFWVEELAAFAFDGLDVKPNVEAAVEYIDPELCHYGGVSEIRAVS